MRTTVKVFSFFFAIATIVACSSGESELLKQARTIQDGIMKSKSDLDSTIDVTITAYNEKLATMSADSVLMNDSIGMVNFTMTQDKVSMLGEYKSKLADWAEGMKMLPTSEEIAKGAENPFGKDAKDQDILNSIKTSQEEFNALKSDIETAMQ